MRAEQRVKWATSGRPIVIKYDEIDNVFRVAVKALSQSKEEESVWIEEIRHDNQDAIVALLIPTLVGLKRLEMTVYHHRMTYYRKMLQSALSNNVFWNKRLPFPPVENIMAECGDKFGMHPDLLALYLQLPSTRAVYGLWFGSDYGVVNAALASLETRSSAVTHLEFKSSNISGPDLENMLRACKAPKTLMLEYYHDYVSFVPFNLTELRKSLEVAKDTLENIYLDYDNKATSWLRAADLTAFASLADFRVLKHIKAGAFVYLGDDPNSSFFEVEEGQRRNGSSNKARYRLVDLLPPSIETLHFTHSCRHIYFLGSALEELLVQKEHRTPKLSKITIEAAFYNKTLASFAPLDALAETVGVTICKFDTRNAINQAENGWGMDCSISWAPGLDGRTLGPTYEAVN
ncbi:hypothetical protein MMC06_000545 [Schaereria dolodes]|nr:hypothetical protein [Schaereria dolodes]